MVKNNSLYLNQALDAANNILSFTRDIDLESFASNELVQNAAIRQLEILGDAVNRLSEEIFLPFDDPGFFYFIELV